MTRPVHLTPAQQDAASRAVWREAERLLAPSRDPFFMRLRREVLIRAYAGPDAEIVLPDGGTCLLGQVGGDASEEALISGVWRITRAAYDRRAV